MRRWIFGEAFELDLPSDKKALLESADSILTQHFVASKEFMLLLTLQGPVSSKFSDRLVDYIAEAFYGSRSRPSFSERVASGDDY